MIKTILQKIDNWIVARFEPSLLKDSKSDASQVIVATSVATSLFF